MVIKPSTRRVTATRHALRQISVATKEAEQIVLTKRWRRSDCDGGHVSRNRRCIARPVHQRWSHAHSHRIQVACGIKTSAFEDLPRAWVQSCNAMDRRIFASLEDLKAQVGRQPFRGVREAGSSPMLL